MVPRQIYLALLAIVDRLDIGWRYDYPDVYGSIGVVLALAL